MIHFGAIGHRSTIGNKRKFHQDGQHIPPRVPEELNGRA